MIDDDGSSAPEMIHRPCRDRECAYCPAWLAWWQEKSLEKRRLALVPADPVKAEERKRELATREAAAQEAAHGRAVDEAAGHIRTNDFFADVATVMASLAALGGKGKLYTYLPGAGRARLATIATANGMPRIIVHKSAAQVRGLLATAAIESARVEWKDLAGRSASLRKYHQAADLEVTRVTGKGITKGKKKDREHGMPSVDVLSTVAELGEWNGVPVLRGIAPLPLMRLDGSVAMTEGYDAASCWWCTSAIEAQQDKTIEAVRAMAGRRGSMEELSSAAGWPGAAHAFSRHIRSNGILLEETGRRTGDSRRKEYLVGGIGSAASGKPPLYLARSDGISGDAEPPEAFFR